MPVTASAVMVSSSAGPLPEVAGDAAVVLPPEDPSAWAAALYDVLTDATLGSEMRRRGQAWVKRFSWDRAALETRDVYREALLA